MSKKCFVLDLDYYVMFLLFLFMLLQLLFFFFSVFLCESRFSNSVMTSI